MNPGNKGVTYHGGPLDGKQEIVSVNAHHRKFVERPPMAALSAGPAREIPNDLTYKVHFYYESSDDPDRFEHRP